jgi:hypothetical protein
LDANRIAPSVKDSLARRNALRRLFILKFSETEISFAFKIKSRGQVLRDGITGT